MSRPASPAPDPETLELLERLAARVVGARMSVPAILFLESMKPMSFVGSQALGFFEPLARALFPWDDLERLRLALEDRQNVERLMQMIERREAERGRAPKPDGKKESP